MIALCEQTTIFEHKALWRRTNGERVFVKVFSSSDEKALQKARGGVSRERTCLEVLEGLAVPRLVTLGKNELPSMPGMEGAMVLAQSYAGEKDVHHIGLEPFQLVAAWVFVVEQLAAMRLHQIIYTDFKCGNVMASCDPLRITIIDFDHSFPMDRPRKKLLCHGYTPGFASPEAMQGDVGTERSLVYECALLLFHFLTDGDGGTLHHPRHGLPLALKRLGKMGASHLGEVLASCLSTEPSARPKHYEHLLQCILQKNLPDKIAAFWRVQRAPYEARLQEVGL
ncbi:MAG: hypothetical protein U0174_12715 [Polyangiaceae bacterium]